ncbi:MAG: histidine kinase [Spirochaetaceae bacterium]|nr:histidine kinase [Spirochaetaceae bacterium]
MENVGKGNYSKKKFVTYFDEDDSLTSGFNLMSDKLEAQQKNKEKSYRESLSSEIEALSFEIKPRFMCNTLEIIEKLSKIEKNSETRLLSKALLTITKYNTETTNNLVSIEKEVENIEAYTYIMNAQNYKPFELKIDIEECILNNKIPSLLLQPIIENSSKHGFKEMEKESIITLSIKKIDNNIRIIIRDNGRGIDKVKLSKLFEDESDSTFKNHSLVNIKKRLLCIYCDKASLTIQSEDKNVSYFENIITIPTSIAK